MGHLVRNSRGRKKKKKKKSKKRKAVVSQAKSDPGRRGRKGPEGTGGGKVRYLIFSKGDILYHWKKGWHTLICGSDRLDSGKRHAIQFAYPTKIEA